MKYNLTKNTKIVCTIGPASENSEMLRKLIDNGMNIMRLNFSHGSYEEHYAKIKRLREFEKEGIYIPVMLDTKGPEIRCHDMENDKINIVKGQKLNIAITEVLGTPEKISVNFPRLYDDVKIDSHIKIDDGKLDLVVVGKDEANKEIITKALNNHVLCSKKGVNCTGARVSLDFISDKDREDIIWGCHHDVDMISASFVRNASDVEAIRQICTEEGHPEVKIIAKIENSEAMDYIDEIIAASDGVMVARGDLGIEIPEELVPIVQGMLIKKCRSQGKPVVTATQMLDSMCHSPIPTRAEVSDVATAISESTDCVMLSGESASGEYPAESVLMQTKISRTMEKHLDYELMASEAFETSNKDNSDALANSIANTAKLINAKVIVSYTETGRSSRRISKARPCCPVLSISNNITTVRQNGLYWGIYSTLIDTPRMPDFIEEMEVIAIIKAKEMGFKAGDTMLLCGGTPTAARKANFMKIVQIPEDRDVL